MRPARSADDFEYRVFTRKIGLTLRIQIGALRASRDWRAARPVVVCSGQCASKLAATRDSLTTEYLVVGFATRRFFVPSRSNFSLIECPEMSENVLFLKNRRSPARLSRAFRIIPVLGSGTSGTYASPSGLLMPVAPITVAAPVPTSIL